MEQAFLTTSEVAEILGVSPRTVRLLCEQRKIQYRQLTPRKIEIRKDWLDSYIDAHTIKPENFNLKEI